MTSQSHLVSIPLLCSLPNFLERFISHNAYDDNHLVIHDYMIVSDISQMLYSYLTMCISMSTFVGDITVLEMSYLLVDVYTITFIFLI